MVGSPSSEIPKLVNRDPPAREALSLLSKGAGQGRGRDGSDLIASRVGLKPM